MVRVFYEDRNGNCDVIQEFKGRLTSGKFKMILAMVYDMTNPDTEIIATIEVNGVPTIEVNGCFYEGLGYSVLDEFKTDSIRIYAKHVNGLYQFVRRCGC